MGERAKDDLLFLVKLCLYYSRRNVFPQDFVIYLDFGSRELGKSCFLFDTMLLREKKKWDFFRKKGGESGYWVDK